MLYLQKFLPARSILSELSKNKAIIYDPKINHHYNFRLEKQLNESGDKISPSQKLYYQAFVENAFNRNEAAAATIDSLLDGGDSSYLIDSAKAVLKLLQGDSYFKCFNTKAAQEDSIVLARYASALGSGKIGNIKNELASY